MDLTTSARAPKQAADADTAVGHSISSRLRRRAVRAGLGLGVLGAVSLAWVAVSAPGHPVSFLEASASTGPPCGANELCIKQSQVPTTAKTFSGGGCGDLQSANPTEDLWHFVIPSGASFNSNTAHFTAIFGTTQIHAASIGGPSDKFAFVYSPAGATLTWAFATNIAGTPVQDYFVLSGTCPASQGSSSSSSSTTTTTSKSSSTTSHSSSSTSSSTTTTSSSSTTSSHTVTSTSSPTNGVLGNSTSSTSTDARGGVGGLITAPNTGAGEGLFALVGVMLTLSGVAVVAVWGRRPSR